MPFLSDLANGIDSFPYYYGGLGNFTQKSIPYDGDILGYGYSGQPYVQVGINPDLQFQPYGDDLIRGGILNTSLAIARDEVRLAKFLGDVQIGQRGPYYSINGPLFLLKQVGLQRSNPQFENLGDATSDKRTYNREYNLLDVLLNAATSPFGLHYDQNGLITGQKSYAGNYQTGESGIAAENMTSFDGTNGNQNPKANRLVTYFNSIRVDPTNYLLKSQSGGSDSVYGLGKTEIFRVKNTGPLNDATTDKDPITGGINYGKVPTTTSPIIAPIGTFKPFSYSRLSSFIPDYTSKFTSQKDNLAIFSGSNFNTDFKDFRALQNGSTYLAPSYPYFNIENRVGTVTNNNPSYKVLDTTKGSYGFQNNIGTIDSINTIKITKAKTFYDASAGAKLPSKLTGSLFQLNNPTDVDRLSGYFGRDIIKFRIEVNNNDKPGVNNNEVLAFRAYIENMDDDFNAKWNEFRYMGRGEPFYVYEGYTREMSLSFIVFAHTAQEMAPLYNKLNYLASSLAPDYSSRLLMRGNYHYLTVGDYLYRQPGVITSMRLTNFFDHNWEIGINEPDDTSSTDYQQYELPKYLKVSLSFKPIHTFLPRRNTVDNYTAPYITPDIKAYEYGYVEKTVDGKKVLSNKYLPITRK
jgi:hypothetical protein